MKPSLIQARTTVLFGAGLVGVAYETLVSQADRPTLLILFAAMMGLPLFLRADEKTFQIKAPPEVEEGPPRVEPPAPGIPK